ncbi:uncharacterized protein OCT59_009640 [Rhizophagus irregularis]|uniref:uncharacterized protein n=1 Tax=Rhizophagus irregularis TaxID=588596 RepID=UPI0033339744|nr:hypothetical protein OCT59_009640 [Rhizophagus irregularis]
MHGETKNSGIVLFLGSNHNEVTLSGKRLKYWHTRLACLNLYLDWADSRISETCEKALIRLIKGIDLGVVDDSEAIVMSMGKESSINIVGSCETCAPSSEVVAGFSVTVCLAADCCFNCAS